MKKLAILFIILVSFNSLIGQDKQLEKQLKGLDSYIENAMKDWNVPGLALGIIKDGKLVYAKGFGVKDIESKEPITPHTLFAIGSSSKAFTATAVCQLMDDELLELDEPLKTYLPDFELYDEHATELMTPRDLLCHRSGLPRHDFVWYGTDKSRKELYAGLKYLEPTQPFRSAWQYQNLMFMTAGYLVEKVSGETWEAFVQKRIFEPLGMNNSNFSVEDMQKAEDFALPFNQNEDDSIYQMKFRNIDAIGPAGSINSNVEDMSKWVIMQLAKGKFGEEEIVSEGALAQTHRPTSIVPGNASDEVFYSSYGLGWFITSYRGHVRVEHGGNIDGFSAGVGLLPRDSIGVVVLTNMNGNGMPSIVRNMVFDRLLDLEEIDWHERVYGPIRKAKENEDTKPEEEDITRKKDTKPAHTLSDYAGTYSHPAYGTIEVKMDKDTLRLTRNGAPFTLHHFHFETFEAKHPLLGSRKVTFHTNPKGDIFMVSTNMQTGVDDIEFEREIEPMDLESSELEKYSGEYEISGMTITIAVNEEKALTMTVPGQPVYVLVPIKPHNFELKGLEGFSVIFEVDDAGEAKSLVSSQPNGNFKAVKK